MSTIDRLDWLILKEISRSADGVQPFTLHRRLSITASQLAIAVGRLSKDGYVDVEEGAERIKATDAGLARLQETTGRRSSAMRAVGEIEDGDQDWIWRDRLEVNAPYIPRLDLL